MMDGPDRLVADALHVLRADVAAQARPFGAVVGSLAPAARQGRLAVARLANDTPVGFAVWREGDPGAECEWLSVLPEGRRELVRVLRRELGGRGIYAYARQHGDGWRLVRWRPPEAGPAAGAELVKRVWGRGMPFGCFETGAPAARSLEQAAATAGRELAARLKPRKAGRYLDICSGSAAMCLELAAAGAAAVGLEASAYQILLNGPECRNNPGISLVHGDPGDIPADLGQFDGVVAFELARHSRRAGGIVPALAGLSARPSRHLKETLRTHMIDRFEAGVIATSAGGRVMTDRAPRRNARGRPAKCQRRSPPKRREDPAPRRQNRLRRLATGTRNFSTGSPSTVHAGS